MSIDPRALRDALSHFATGVTVITCEIDGAPHGATVNSFTAVSLDPPLVLVSLDRRSKACRYLEGRPFVVNVLHEQQTDIAMHFAGRPTHQPIEWRQGRLKEALAHISCEPWRHYDGGDHLLFLGRVTDVEVHDGDPLLFYRGAFRRAGRAQAPWFGSSDCPELGWFTGAITTRGA